MELTVVRTLWKRLRCLYDTTCFPPSLSPSQNKLESEREPQKPNQEREHEKEEIKSLFGIKSTYVLHKQERTTVSEKPRGRDERRGERLLVASCLTCVW